MLPFLVEHLTCYLMSPKGRGLSGDKADHSRERQFEDVAAHVESIGEPAGVFGHSSGAFWALGGAALSPARFELSRCTSPRSRRWSRPPPTTSTRGFRAAVTDGRLADGVRITTGEIIGLDCDELALFEAPGVAERVQAVLPLAVQELPEVNRPIEETLLEGLTMPVLVLQRERSRIEFKNAARLLTEKLKDARVVEIPGAGHIGALTTAEPVARELVGFLRS